jgi:ATP-dependent helicase/nuclease subunit B
VEDTFTRAGLALSGLPVERWRRDLGREALFHFLYCRQKPAPAMALAVCLSSPLMPWSREEGAVLAQKVMDGDYRLRPLSSFGREGHAMLDLIREGDEAPQTLLEAVHSFVSLLLGGDEFTAPMQQAKVAAEGVCALLAGADDIDWVNLRRSISPRYITTGESPDFNLEGITVWREGHEPWRTVRHLIVFGFAEGNYPTVSGSSAVFAADDLKAIRDKLVLPVDTPEDELRRCRARFKRQLNAVSDFVCFLVPRRKPDGEAQAPSESIVFMHQLFDTPSDEPESIILELDAAADRTLVRYLAQADPSAPAPPRDIQANDIHFGVTVHFKALC